MSTEQMRSTGLSPVAEPIVLINFALRDDELALIRDWVPTARLVLVQDSTTGLEQSIPEAHVLLGRGDNSTISPELLRRAERLEWIHSWAAGPDSLLFPDLIQSRVVVTSSAGSGAVGMAEHTVMLMLMLNAGAIGWIRAQDERRWERGVHPELRGLTCGIIGLGHTGQDLATKLAAFHMRVIGMRRSVKPVPSVDRIFPRDQLDEFLSSCDFVVVAAPLTPETAGMLGEDEFRSMKPSAYYLCATRGGVADEAALIKALLNGWIAGAGLDAFAEEPLPPDSPLWSTPNTIITPHIGAQTPARRRASLDMFIENLQAFVQGRPLSNVVDKTAGY